MTIDEITKRPTVVKEIPSGSSGVHESLLYSYQLLAKVNVWLSRGMPVELVLELQVEIEDIRIRREKGEE